MNLKSCPCGKTPIALYTSDAGQGEKYAWAIPSCCGEWSIEFRTDNEQLESSKFMELAEKAWNAAPRG